MKGSRDRARKRAGRQPTLEKKTAVSDGELSAQLAEFCRRVRQQNRLLTAILRQRQQLIALLLRDSGRLQ